MIARAPTLARAALAALAALAVAAPLALGGCVTTVHRADAPIDLQRPISDETAAAEGMVVTPAAVERLAERRLAQYTRRIRPAHNVDIVATLWDPALLAVDPVARGIRTSAGLSEDPADAAVRLERWRDRYLRDQTAFSVVVELANRPGPDPRRIHHGGDEGSFDDPLVAPRNWSFELELPGGEVIAPARIEVQAVDRFPTRAGGHHYRIAFAVHFPGEITALLGAAPEDASRIKLRVRPLIESPRDAGFGRATARHGFAITWWLRAASTADSDQLAKQP